VGFLFFIKDMKNGWPLLLVGSFLTLNEAIGSFLTARDLIQPLTQLVGSMSELLAFSVTFVLLVALLAATGVRPTASESAFRA
jgi:hypothetical protein